MPHSDLTTRHRIGRPPKVDAHGVATRERLLRAAVDACVEHGYEGVTLADIARRAQVSTPAIYSHFTDKANLLVEASKHELDTIANRWPGDTGLREIARQWLQPDFASTRILVTELHCAAIRQPVVAELLAEWQERSARRLARQAGLSAAQAKTYYLLLVGLSHTDQITGVRVTQDEIELQVDVLIERWFAAADAMSDVPVR